MSIYSRVGDMGEGLKLQILKEDDGDLIVSIFPESHRGPVTGQYVQFCTPMSGGGKSPRTWNALFDLWCAMREDEAESAQQVGGSK